MNRSGVDYKQTAALVVCIAGGCAAVFILLKYLFPVAFPFLIAWGAALLLRPLNVFLHRKTRLPLRLVSALTVLFALLLAGGLFSLILFRLVAEIREFAVYLTENPDVLSESLGWLEPFLRSGGEAAEGVTFLDLLIGYLQKLLVNGAEKLLSGIPAWLGNAVLALPETLLFIFISIVAAFYFSMDLQTVNDGIKSLLPERFSSLAGNVRSRLFHTGWGYVRSYLILTGTIMGLLLLGFMILGVRYALLLSLVFALLDLLPVVGVGTMLIPWSIFSFATGNLFLGIGLLVLFALIETVRQIMEPRLVGKALGVHPLLSLFSLYAGARFLGVVGILIGPIAAVLAKSLYFAFGKGKPGENKKPVG